MNKNERVKVIMKTLNKLYPKIPIPLKHKNNFELLIAVLLSAQCTDERVNTVTPKLFSKANNPHKMISLSEREIYNIVRPCGLAPQKSKAIYNLSRILIEEFRGKIPQNYEDLEKLPGVGHKTASVVMSQWYNIPAFPVDTHIHRLASRWGLSNGRNVEKTEKDLKKIWDKHLWNRRHLQIIFFGREHCPARNHDLAKCIICSWAATKKRIKAESKTNN